MSMYNVVETTKLTEPCFSFVSDVDLENGSLIAKGELVSGEREIYKAVEPTANDEVYLVANPAWSYDNSRPTNQNEENYINKAGKPFRAYAMKKDNKYAIQDYGVKNGTTIAIGDYITADGYQNKDAGTTAPTAGFVGKVVEVENYGFAFCTGTAGNIGAVGKKVVIEVIKNENV